ncbi:MAG: hypothetical protein GY803_00500 [Chloroflexi bacterium]|nr:hypothetical protein [Chloroflexota bacterium]
MTTTAIVTATKMMEMLPEYAQNQAVEHLRNFIADMQDEQQWDNLFNKTQNQLMVAAKQARKEIAAGRAKLMDVDQL